MNYAQILSFIGFVISVFISGAWTYSIWDNSESYRINKITYLGEVLLIGSIVLVGELFVLSLLKLYKPPFLWSVVFLNYLFIIKRNIRKSLFNAVSFHKDIDVPTVLFYAILAVFIFRNCYLMIDVDSASTYLFTQKLWLANGTSFVGNATNDIRIFNPQFDAVPYSLGIGIFGYETLFPQLINLFWRLICLLLVFGYTSYRFNPWHALAGVFFLVFNDHFFFSGANQWVVINAVVIALLFASAYNFWEAKAKNDSHYFFLALLFSSQLLSNKSYIVGCFIFLILLGFAIQDNLLNKLKVIFTKKVYLYSVLIAFLLTFLWYLKNIIVTGTPLFPLFAGKLHAFGWTSAQESTYLKYMGGLNPFKILKYMSFIFIWPGVNPAKYVLVIITMLPIILFVYMKNNIIEKEHIQELCFWLGLCLLLVFGLCLSCWWDPRPYRFMLGILSFAALFSLNFILKYCFKIKKEFILSGILLILAVPGYKIIFQGGNDDGFKRPTFKENAGVLLDKVHMNYIINKHNPTLTVLTKESQSQRKRINKAAWAFDPNSYAFFLDILAKRPVVNIWYSSTIKWDSYHDKSLVVKDLHSLGIEEIVTIGEEGKLNYTTVEDYANYITKADRLPDRICYDYGFPDELKRIK